MCAVFALLTIKDGTGDTFSDATRISIKCRETVRNAATISWSVVIFQIIIWRNA